MSRSLDYLTSCLQIEAFKYTIEAFPIEEQFNFMKQKSVYPYDYMDSFHRFEVTELPSKEQFYSILKDERITDDAYKRAQNVWSID